MCDVYFKYLNLAHQFSSQPVYFHDAFSMAGVTDGVVFRDKKGVVFSGLRAKASKITVTGKGVVTIVLGAYSVVDNLLINCTGEDLFVFVGPYSELKNVLVQSRDAGAFFHFGAGSTDNGGNYYIKGKSQGIFIGHDCMFSTGVHIRTSDSHSIFSYDTGRRINTDRTVALGNHVWVGRQVTIGKGSSVPDDVVLGQGSVVSGELNAAHAIYAGCPAKMVKENVTWDRTSVSSLQEIAFTLEKRVRQKKVNDFLLIDKPFVFSKNILLKKERSDFLTQNEYRWLQYQNSIQK